MQSSTPAKSPPDVLVDHMNANRAEMRQYHSSYSNEDLADHNSSPVNNNSPLNAAGKKSSEEEDILARREEEFRTKMAEARASGKMKFSENKEFLEVLKMQIEVGSSGTSFWRFSRCRSK